MVVCFCMAVKRDVVFGFVKGREDLMSRILELG